MSSYVNFYLRVNDKFAPIGSWSRSSAMYRTWQGSMPYEKIRPITDEKLKYIINDFKDQISSLERHKADYEADISLIMNANNTPLEEKIDGVAAIREEISEINDEIEDFQYCISTMEVFCDMIEDYRYADDPKFDNDYNNYIYGGIEAFGRLEDIEKED